MDRSASGVRRLVALLTVLAAALPWASARAEAGGLLPVSAEAELSASERAEALEASVSFFARLPEPVPLTPPTQGANRTANRYAECAEPSCAGPYAQALDLDFAVLVRLFAPTPRSAGGSVSAAIVTPEALAYVGTAEVGAAGMFAAVSRALGIAYERYRRGPGPWLSVEGPDGSRVRIDDHAPAGTPYTERHEPGVHRVYVENEAGKPLYELSLRLPDDPAHHERLRVEPAPSVPTPTEVAASSTPAAAAATAAAPAPREERSYWRRRRSKWNYYVGVPIALVGAFYTAVGIGHYLARGDCAERAQSTCVRRKTVDAGSRAALIGGLGGLAVGGGLFVSAGVLRTSGERSLARFGVGGSF